MATMTEQPTEVRRADIEAWLTERAVDWRFEPELPIIRINEKLSLANQARLEPLNQEVVDRYTADLERGDVFPPVLALETGNARAKVRLLGGNHRLRAHTKAGRETIAAYVLKAEPEMAMRLTYEDNRRHGLQPTDSERIVQGLHLLGMGWTLDAAAACVGLTGPRLSQERTMANAMQRASELGVDMDGFGGLQRWSRYALGRLRSDPVFAEACGLAITARLSLDEVKALVQQLDEAKSDKDAFEILGLEHETLQSRIQRTGGGKIKKVRTPRAVLLTSMREIRNRTAAAVVGSIPSPEARAEMRKEVDNTIAHLEGVKKALR